MTGGVVRVTVFRFSARPNCVQGSSDKTMVSWRWRLAAWLFGRV